jgi:hypothetical protein
MSADSSADSKFKITVTDDYHGTFDQSRIDAWELEHARTALKLLKTALGKDEIVRLLQPQIKMADERGRRIAEASDGTWKAVQSVFEVHGLTHQEWLDWFQVNLFNEEAMTDGHPEHYEIRYPDAIVTETLGGIPTRFKILRAAAEMPKEFKRDPTYPIFWGDEARASMTTLLDGTPRGLITGMELRPTEDGFFLKNTLFWSSASPPEMFILHKRHYAIEFTRWLTMAYEAKMQAS